MKLWSALAEVEERFTRLCAMPTRWGGTAVTYGELRVLQQRELADWREAHKDEVVLF